MTEQHQTTEFNLLSAGAAAAYVGRMQPAFERTHHCILKGQFSAAGAIKERFLAGDPCDALILSKPLMEELAAAGHVSTKGIHLLGSVHTALAVRDNAPVPRVVDETSLRTALLAASAIHLPDLQRSTAGGHMKRVLEALGILDEVLPKLRPAPNGATAMHILASTGIPGALGCTQVTEIAATPGLTLVGPLPAPYSLKTDYCVTVPKRSTQPLLATQLLGALCAPDAAATRQACGFSD